MTKQEFLEKWANVNLGKYHVEIGKKSNFPFDRSIYEEDHVWKIAEADEYHHIEILYEGTEEEMFNEMNEYIEGEKEISDNICKMKEEREKLQKGNS